MVPGNKSNKVKHFQTIEKKMINGKNTKRRENRGFELHIWAEKRSKCCANNGEKNVMAAIQVT